METLEEKSNLLGLQADNSMEQPFTVSSLKKLVAIPDHTDISVTPEERVRALSKLGSNITINEDITPRRYFRSGVEMERMASVYMEEGNLENAFVFYNKFITLFVEKLPSHRDYHQCAVPEKQDIIKKLKEVAFPRTDELKRDLLKKYNLEYQEYMQHKNKCKTEFLKKLEHQKLIEAEKKRIAHMRQQQLESEQFQFFEDQLKKQELARDQKIKESVVMSEQIDGSMLSCISVPENSSLSAALLEKKERSGTAGCAGHSPPVERVLKPAATLSAVQTQLAEALRGVILPRDLCHKFLLLAEANTVRGIETCGILCGKLVQFNPHICMGKTYLIVLYYPVILAFESVSMHSIVSGFSLLLPSQTRVLNAIFLHILLNKVIIIGAIHLNTGIFRLTNAGMLEVSACRKKGFHPHTKDPRLFNPCTHVVGKDIKIIVLDLR
ncbi:STALP protease, partial [Panurus biarmicus]|nr:STALP protease [Panurus biarmicus]